MTPVVFCDKIVVFSASIRIDVTGEHTMKKIKICILILPLLIGLAACGQDEVPENPIVSQSSESAPADVTPAPKAPDDLPSASPEVVTEDDTPPQTRAWSAVL